MDINHIETNEYIIDREYFVIRPAPKEEDNITAKIIQLALPKISVWAKTGIARENIPIFFARPSWRYPRKKNSQQK